MSLSTCYLEHGRHVARLHRRRGRRRRANAPTSNTASHDNHEKINSWVSFCFPYIGCLWDSAWRPRRSSVINHYFATISGKDLRKHYTARIKRIRREQNLQVSYLAVTREEKDLIVKAMGLTQGHWFKCPNGELNGLV